MTTGKRIFISGPYTHPDPCVNTRNAILAAEQLVAAGFVPFVPHLNHLWHLIQPREYDFWLAYDLHWLECCHAVLRLPGESKGADRECEHATQKGIPVFGSLSLLLQFLLPPGSWRETVGCWPRGPDSENISSAEAVRRIR